MPFINGRYHMNAIMGQALEAAREAEAAMRALQNRGSRSAGASRASSASDSPRDASADPLDDDSAAPQDSSSDDASADQAPVHHIEIEVTELVPTSAGRATQGYVVRVHRAPSDFSAGARNIVPGRNSWRKSNDSAQNAGPGAVAPPPETHVFADHGDLLSFLQDALAAK
jgi:hypothetical protein